MLTVIFRGLIEKWILKIYKITKNFNQQSLFDWFSQNSNWRLNFFFARGHEQWSWHFQPKLIYWTLHTAHMNIICKHQLELLFEVVSHSLTLVEHIAQCFFQKVRNNFGICAWMPRLPIDFPLIPEMNKMWQQHGCHYSLTGKSFPRIRDFLPRILACDIRCKYWTVPVVEQSN